VRHRIAAARLGSVPRVALLGCSCGNGSSGQRTRGATGSAAWDGAAAVPGRAASGIGMPTATEESAARLLALMVESGRTDFASDWLQRRSGLSPPAVSDALDYLDDLGAIRAVRRNEGFGFRAAWLQPRGQFLYRAIRAQQDAAGGDGREALLPERPPNPVGSPHGFTADDWEAVALRKDDPQTLYVLLGLQFVSSHYDPRALTRHVRSHFEEAVRRYNERHPDATIAVHFERMLAGLGTHGFSRIARDILRADVAVFETSDWNPNVMLEMGVALTWGVAVVPLRRAAARPIPSDVSGQAYVLHERSAALILSETFGNQLLELIERVMQTKGRP